MSTDFNRNATAAKESYVSSDAKASTVGSAQRQAKGIGRFFRGADATRGASIRANGSGASAVRRLGLSATSLAAILAAMALIAVPASATAPVVSGEHVSAVGSATATLSATVNPQGKLTTYRFEYTDDADFQINGFANAKRKPVPDASAGSGSSDLAVSTGAIGLQPATTYHVRLVAVNPDGTTPGPGVAFTTFAASPTFGPCPNDVFRTGASAKLSDCRAYEQASPVDKNGADVGANMFDSGASVNGDAISFLTVAGVPGAVGSQGFPRYLARRGPSGWKTQGLYPPPSFGEDADVGGWSSDFGLVLSSVTQFGAPQKSSILIKDEQSGSIETIAPYTTGIDGRIAGTSADGSKVFIEGFGSIPVDSGPAPASNGQNLFLFDRDSGELALVGVLPAGEGGAAAPGGSFAGPFEWWRGTSSATLTQGGAFGENYVRDEHAISSSGDKAFFTAGGTGEIYMREGLGTASPDTVRVSASQATSPDPNGSKPKIFLQATPSGSRVFFMSCEKLTDDSTAVSTAENRCDEATQGEDLYAYDTASGGLTDLTVDTGDSLGAAVQGLVGVSDDGSRAYFAANGDLDGIGPATPGDCVFGIYGNYTGTCNLYLWEAAGVGDCVTVGGCTTLIAVLDPSGPGLTRDSFNWSPHPETDGTGRRDARTNFVSADGHAVLFRSRRQLTAYDNKGTPEYYRYDADSGVLACTTCSPIGAPPVGPSLIYTVPTLSSIGLGSLQGGTPPTFIFRDFSTDGSRFFFETASKLVAADTNGDNGCPVINVGGSGKSVGTCQDVYEWEAPGSGSCDQQTLAFSAANGGCLYLISTGTGADPSFLADASASGNDVFIFTRSQLVPQDQDGLQDIYDARVGGGLAFQYETAPPDCTGEACRGAGTSAPSASGTGSAVFAGPGNEANAQRHDCGPAAKRAQRLARASKRLRRQATNTHDPKAAGHLRHKSAVLAKRADRLSRNARRCRQASRKAAR